MLKAFPRYAIGTALLMTGCQAPNWMVWKRPSEAAAMAAAQESSSGKKPLIPSAKKKTNESAELSIATSIGKGKEHLQAFYQNPSQPKALDAAEKSFERALLVDPRNAEAHHGLGVCLDLQKRYPAAEEHYRAAIASEPKNATYHADLGYSYFLQKRYADAEKSLDRALQIDPSNVLAAKNLGMTYARQGKRELAESTFRRVMNDAEVRQAMAQIDGAGGNGQDDIALASGEQPRGPVSKDSSWEDVQSRMEQARLDSIRQREQRDQQDRASQLGIDPERMRQMQLVQAQQHAAGQGQSVTPAGGAQGRDPRDYRGRDPYADMKNQLEALDRNRTNVANGPVYLDQNGFQAVPHQPATYPEAQQTYHPEGAIQPLSGQHVPANSATWTPGAQSPHSAPQGGSLVPPSGAMPGNGAPYYQSPPAGQQAVPRQYQSSYGPTSAIGPGASGGPSGPGQSVANAYGNRPNWPGNGPGQAAPTQAGGYGPNAAVPNGYGPRPQGIQQVSAERMAASGNLNDFNAQGRPMDGSPMSLPPNGQPYGGAAFSPDQFAHDPYAAFAAQNQQTPRGAGQPMPAQAGFAGAGQMTYAAGGPGAPSGSAGRPGFEAEFEQAKREAAMHGLGVGPGPLFPSQSPGQQQRPPMSMTPQGPLTPTMTAPVDPRSQPGDGIQLPGVQWNGAQSAPALRQLPTSIQVPDLRQAGQPQYESNWDLYRQQGNQLGQQTPATSSTYLSQNQYSAGSSFNQTPPAPDAATSLPAVGALSNYDEERLRLSRMNQQQQEVLLRSPSGAAASPAAEQRNFGPVLQSPADQMIPTWGNQSIVPPAWPSRTEDDPNYRARGYDAPQTSSSQYDRSEDRSSRGVVTPDRYPSAGQRSANYGGSSQGQGAPSNAAYSNNNGGGLPAIVPGTRNGY